MAHQPQTNQTKNKESQCRFRFSTNSLERQFGCQQASLSPLVRTSLQDQTKGSAQTISQHAESTLRTLVVVARLQ
jgi:hypothetical protein